MSIVTMFFDQQKAGEINAIINNNFKNVSKYIPIGFDSLTTIERLNLKEDWRENGKLVFDIDQERVYIWDEDVVDWVAYLIEAKDSFARALAAEVQQKSFTKVSLGEDYVLRFKNALEEEVGNQLLSADKIQYDSTDSVLSKINKLVAEDARQQGEIDNINKKIGNIDLPTDAQTLTGAIKELHTELTDDTADLTGIKNGTIVVPKANHAEEADHATDSSNLDGKAPSYYAKQSDMTAARADIDTNTQGIADNKADILELQNDLKAVDDREKLHYDDYTSTKNIVLNAVNKVEGLEEIVVNISSILKVINEDYLIEITESKESYVSPALTNYNPNTDSLKIYINGGYVYSGNYSVAYDETAKTITVTNLNHATNPWKVGWEITILITRLETLEVTIPDTPVTPDDPTPPTPAVTSGVMTATVGDILDETGENPTPIEEAGIMTATVGDNLAETTTATVSTKSTTTKSRKSKSK